jgi:hypothetical protein
LILFKYNFCTLIRNYKPFIFRLPKKIILIKLYTNLEFNTDLGNDGPIRQLTYIYTNTLPTGERICVVIMKRPWYSRITHQFHIPITVVLDNIGHCRQTTRTKQLIHNYQNFPLLYLVIQFHPLFYILFR